MRRAWLWNSIIVQQLDYEAATLERAWLWGGTKERWPTGKEAEAWRHSSTARSTARSTSVLQQKVFTSKGKCAHQDSRELIHIDRSLHPRVMSGTFSYKWGLQIFAVWLVLKVLSWLARHRHSDWSVKMLLGIELCSSDWTGKATVLLVEIQFQEALYKGWLR